MLFKHRKVLLITLPCLLVPFLFQLPNRAQSPLCFPLFRKLLWYGEKRFFFSMICTNLLITIHSISLQRFNVNAMGLSLLGYVWSLPGFVIGTCFQSAGNFPDSHTLLKRFKMIFSDISDRCFAIANIISLLSARLSWLSPALSQ